MFANQTNIFYGKRSFRRRDLRPTEFVVLCVICVSSVLLEVNRSIFLSFGQLGTTIPPFIFIHIITL